MIERTIYVVTSYSGDMSPGQMDYWECQHGGYFNLAQANDKIDKLKKVQKHLNKLSEFKEKFHREWDQQNPMPACKTHKLLAPVRWQPGLRKEQITEEMRAERAAIQLHNDQVHQEDSEARNQWFKTRVAAFTEHAKKHELSQKSIERCLEGISWDARNKRFKVETLKVFIPEITMQDVRLIAGEGDLTATTVLQAINAHLGRD